MNLLAGIVLIIISAVSFGSIPLLGKLVLQENIPISSILFLRFTIAALLIVLLKPFLQFSFPRGKFLFTLILMGALGHGGQSLTYLSALKFAPASTVVVLLYLFPAFVTFMSIVILKQPYNKFEIAALLIALCGTFIIIGYEAGGEKWGVYLAVSAAIIASIYIIVGTAVLKEIDSYASTAVIIISTAFGYGILVSFQGLSFPSTVSGWSCIVALAMISSIIAIVSFLEGLKRIGPIKASMISTFEPVFAIILAVIFLGEKITLLKLLGALLIISSAIILVKYGEKPIEIQKAK